MQILEAMSDSDMVVVKEEPKDQEDNDIVTTNSEMVLDDILGDDIIGETSGRFLNDVIRRLTKVKT